MSDDAKELIAKKRAESKKLRAERNAKELEEIAQLFDPDTHVLVEIDSPPDVIGHVLCRHLTKAESDEYMAVLHRDPSKPGAAEERRKAGPRIAKNTLVWPEDKERYDAMVARCGLAPQMIAARLLEAARGKAEAEEKE